MLASKVTEVPPSSLRQLVLLSRKHHELPIPNPSARVTARPLDGSSEVLSPAWQTDPPGSVAVRQALKGHWKVFVIRCETEMFQRC